MTRIIVQPTKGLLKKIMAIREQFGQFEYFKTDENGDVDMTDFGIHDIADVDTNGDLIMETVSTPFMYKGEAMYRQDTTPVMIESKTPKIIATNKVCVIYEKVFRGYDGLSQKEKNAIIAIIETGIWIGLLTDPDNHVRVGLKKQMRHNSILH